MKLKNKGFTLVELLVVVAIIGLLSSIILVATKNVREKARVAKLLQFDSSIKHALGAEILGEWNFEQISGSTVKDSSGYSRDGILQGSANVVDSGQKWAIGQSLYCPQIGDYVLVNNPDFPDLKAFTVTAWVNTGDNYGSLMTFEDTTSNSYIEIYIDAGGNLCFRLAWSWITPPGAFADTLICPIGANFFKSGEWHHITASYDGSKMRAYLDCEKKCEKIPLGGSPPTNILSSQIVSLKIGASTIDGLTGLVDQVRFYSEGTL